MPNIGEPFIPQKELINREWVGPISPLSLLGCKELAPAARLLWLALSDFAGRNGECFPSYERLAEKAGLSVRGVKKAAKELREKGFITWDAGGRGRSNRYRLLWHKAFEEGRYKSEIRNRGASKAAISGG